MKRGRVRAPPSRRTARYRMSRPPRAPPSAPYDSMPIASGSPMSWPCRSASHSCLPMAMTLSPSSMIVSGRSGVATPSRMTANSEQPSGIARSFGARPIAGEPACRCASISSSSPSPSVARWSSSWTGMSCSMEPEDHPGRADQLVDAEVPEERLVLRVVDPGDRPRDVEVVLGHLADDEVVLVIAGHGGHDVGPVAAGLGEVLALAAVVGDDDRADLVGDLAAPACGSFSMSATSWPDSISSLAR